jgi:hypothetical protein
MKKRDGLQIILFIVLTISVALVGFSLNQLIFENQFIPYLLLFGGTLFSAIGSSAILLSGMKGKWGVTLTIFTLLNSLLFMIYYFYPSTLKEFYSFSIWSLLLIVLFSIQHTLKRYKKPFHQLSKYLNFGIVFVLLPFFIFKVDDSQIWFLLNAITGLVLLSNLILFLLPSKQRTS